MELSWSSISAGAMTAAVSLGSSLHALGTSASMAAQALPTATAGGLQALAHSASTAVATAASTMPLAVPLAVDAGAVGTAQLATDLSYVEKPAKAIAAAAPRSSVLIRTAGFLSKALPVVTIGASTLAGARIVNDQGARALVTSKDGRGAVLGAVAVNQFGGMDRLDERA